MLRTAGIWVLIGSLTIVHSTAIVICVALTWPLDPKRRLAHGLASRWGRAIFWCIPSWRVSVEGQAQLDARQPYILVSNHQSLLDIMALCHLRQPFKWVAKASLFDIPLMGWAMLLAGYIKLSRGEHGSIRRTYERARRWLASGISVFFFPEGTRSRTGQLGPFKNGAFKLAMDTQIPIVPIVITGTRDMLVRGSWLFGWGGQVRITVLAPLQPAHYHDDGATRLRDDARQQIQRALERLAAR